jgi:hypothetical protein
VKVVVLFSMSLLRMRKKIFRHRPETSFLGIQPHLDDSLRQVIPSYLLALLQYTYEQNSPSNTNDRKRPHQNISLGSRGQKPQEIVEPESPVNCT